MKVLKFGGTSVGSTESIRNVIDILQSQDKHVVVVFSALSGVTNMLVECMNYAASKNLQYRDIVEEIENRHFSIANQFINPQKVSGTLARIKQSINQLQETLEGISYIGEITTRTSDLILGYGEYLSIQLLNAILSERLKQVTLMDARELIYTKPINGGENLAITETEKAIRDKLSAISGTVITSGFVATSIKGYPSTLGRGGSDYTASIIASALDAEILEIWTDVSGIYTADPSLTKNAYPIPELSYAEALELSHFGAKVIYAPTIQPVMEKKIPVLVKNTFAAADVGTMIVEKPIANGSVVKAISSINNICLVSLTGSGMVGVVGIASRLFRVLAKENINVILITQASSEQSICIAIDEKQGDKACEALNAEFEFEIQLGRVKSVRVEDGFSIVAMVGEKMRHAVGASGQAFSALGRNGINIHAIAQGSSELNVSVVVNRENCQKAVNAIHQEFFHSVNREINLFVVGTGNVGSAFINQILSQLGLFRNDYSIDFRIVGIANSRKMLLDPTGIKDSDWKEALMASKEAMVPDHFIEEMFALNLPNSIFIDNTASDMISGLYHAILSKSISIVTCNKIAASSAYDNYSELKRIAQEKRVFFKFESNVGAGLPIIQTISNLVKTGDQIHQIEAVVSGSLNFIFNGFCDGMKFSDAVLKAKDLGYTEPNPLIDLRGTDVSRKLLILVREAGIKLESSEIVFNSYLPHALPGSYSSDLFPEQMKEYDEYFEGVRERISSNRQKLRFVAQFDKGKASIALKEVNPNNPLYSLEGSDNVVSIHSKRYSSRPLVIQGAGAGADVTASGIFSDILSIINN